MDSGGHPAVSVGHIVREREPRPLPAPRLDRPWRMGRQRLTHRVMARRRRVRGARHARVGRRARSPTIPRCRYMARRLGSCRGPLVLPALGLDNSRGSQQGPHRGLRVPPRGCWRGDGRRLRMGMRGGPIGLLSARDSWPGLAHPTSPDVRGTTPYLPPGAIDGDTLRAQTPHVLRTAGPSRAGWPSFQPVAPDGGDVVSSDRSPSPRTGPMAGHVGRDPGRGVPHADARRHGERQRTRIGLACRHVRCPDRRVRHRHARARHRPDRRLEPPASDPVRQPGRVQRPG